MHSGFAPRLVAPAKGAVGKVQVDALRQHPAPQHANLLALSDAVGRNKGGTRGRLGGRSRLQIAGSFDVPGADKIQQPGVVYAAKNGAGIFTLGIIHKLCAHKRRVAQ